MLSFSYFIFEMKSNIYTCNMYIFHMPKYSLWSSIFEFETIILQNLAESKLGKHHHILY